MSPNYGAPDKEIGGRGREGGANKGGMVLGAGPRRWCRLGAGLSGLGSRGGGAEVVAQG